MGILNGRQNFYVIVGSSAGALIGLHFVVIAQIDRVPQPAAEAGCRNGKMLQLLFIGIQNAGDAATYHIFVGKESTTKQNIRGLMYDAL